MFSALIAASLFQGQTEVQPDWVTKDHSIRLAGQSVQYQTTAGLMPIRARNGDIDGKIFFTYYRRTNVSPNKRPLIFVFNGGPGSASVWLHLGFVGPKRPKMGSVEGFMPAPPYELVPNDESILPETDIVTIDPVGTGYSRPTKPEDGAKFWGVDVDIASVGEFIRSFLTTENRWLSPIFLMGESYGGIRGAGLSSWLHGRGVGVNGVILLSPLLGPATVKDVKTTDSRFVFIFPTFVTSAWYHHRLSPELQKMPVADIYTMALKFAKEELLPALTTKDLPADKKKEMVTKIHNLTGLSETYIDSANLRISEFRWFRECLRDEHKIVGRYDSRYIGIDIDPSSNRGGEDPSYTQVQPVFTSTINEYLTEEIGYKTTLKYAILGEAITGPWKYPEGNQPLDKSDAIRQAVTNNPYTKFMIAMGYYDGACMMGTNDQLLDNLNLDPILRNNIVRTRYEAGHMVYLDQNCRRQFHRDVANFIKSQTNPIAPNGAFKRN